MIFVIERKKNNYNIVMTQKNINIFDALLNNLVNNCNKDYIESKLPKDQVDMLEKFLEYIDFCK